MTGCTSAPARTCWRTRPAPTCTHRLAGRDTLLMAGTEARAAELSRRVREDLIRWGIVKSGPVIRLRGGAQASAGDWIMARKNDATTRASQCGRALVDRDILQLVDADPHGTGMSAQVVRLMGRDESGRERWSAPFLVSRSYLWNEAQLGYAVTFHAAEGRTVDSAIAVFSGEEDRQAAYVAMSRGRENNEAYVIAGWRIAAEALGRQPGTCPRIAKGSDGRGGPRLPGRWPGTPVAGRRACHGRGEIRRAEVDADRARRSAQAADTTRPQRLAERAEISARWEEMTRDVVARLAEARPGTTPARRLPAPPETAAVAADAGCRRHPDAHVEPLRAQPRPVPEPVPPAQRPTPLLIRRAPGGCRGT